jgi:protein-L-isoaspartate O-methyltransferase
MEAIPAFLAKVTAALTQGTLSKITLSKPRSRSAEWRNLYGRLVLIKGEQQLSCTLKYNTRDETRNFSLVAAPAQIEQWLAADFFNADLFTETEQHILQINKKGKALLRQQDIAPRVALLLAHDQTKQRPLTERPRPYLTALGIAGQDGQILKQGQRKYRQINKYIELIGHLLQDHPLPADARIVDMGSGKGYLTFALYDYLVNEKKLVLKMTGVELRPELVEACNHIAQTHHFDHLEFHAGDIHQYQPAGGIDMLIALHACDTATDEALAKGIRAGADIIIVAPCCHKQVRKAMHPPADLQPILRYGILLERQAELLTDGLRALLLEDHGYRTKVFEFIGTEHTPKNVMITAVKGITNPQAAAEIAQLKQTFGLSRHHLEDLLKK